MSSYVDSVRPSNKIGAFTYDLLCVLGGSLFLALLSQLSVYLWFSLVPITLQTFGVMLIGGLLGSKKGALSILAYVFEGAIGLPVFAGGLAGFPLLFGPTGGYLLGFVFAAFGMGYLLEKGWKESYKLTLVAFGLGSLLILAIGALWLSAFVGIHSALIMGVYPFLVGSALKSIAAAAIIPSGWKALNWIK